MHYCKYFLLFGSERYFSLSMNQMVSVAHKETVYHVCLLREHHWGFTVRPGSSSVCKTLRGVCLSLLGHQMGGVYGIRRHREWQDVHTFARKYLKVSSVVVFLIDSSPAPHTSGKADRAKARSVLFYVLPEPDPWQILKNKVIRDTWSFGIFLKILLWCLNFSIQRFILCFLAFWECRSRLSDSRYLILE